MVGADGLFLLGSDVLNTNVRSKKLRAKYSYMAVAVLVTIPRPAQSLKHSRICLHYIMHGNIFQSISCIFLNNDPILFYKN